MTPGTWPSPAEEELVDTLSLKEYLLSNPAASFMLRVRGSSLVYLGIYPGDIVIIERGRRPKQGDIVLAQVAGEWILKDFTIYPEEEFMITGVMTVVMRKYH